MRGEKSFIAALMLDGVIQIIFLALYLAGIIDWPVWCVLCPLIVTVIGIVVLIMVAMYCGLILSKKGDEE